MSQFIFIGNQISVYTLRDYIMRHKIDATDTLILNPHDFDALIHDMKTSGEGLPDFPVKILEVIIVKDTTDTVPIGKLQIVKNEKPYL